MVQPQGFTPKPGQFHPAADTQGHPLRPLATYDTLDQLEGDPIEGAVILEFPDMAAARAWYDSPSYQAAVKFRRAGSKSRAFFIEGL